MRALTFSVIAILIVLGIAPAWAQTPEMEATEVGDVIRKVRKGVIRVEGVTIDYAVATGLYGGGSGFIFEVDYDNGTAYGITNHHVSGDASVVAVTFWDDAQYRGELVATEPGIDIALIKIVGIPDERNLPDDEKTIVPVVLGDSDQVQIGELAVAMGNPGAYEGFNIDRSAPYEAWLLKQTATAAVVTGRDTPLAFEIGIWNQQRSRMHWQYGTNFDYAFRMSVAINPGNSGGPLFNGQGEVIGINFYGGGGSLVQNHNWAIPINLAKDFAYQILETGKYEKPWLGLDIIMPPYIAGADAYMEFKERFRPDHTEVYGVRPGSPAEDAGFQKGDIILTVDGQAFETPEDIRLYVFDLEIGSTVSFKVKRLDSVTGKIKELGEPIDVVVAVKRNYDAEFSV